MPKKDNTPTTRTKSTKKQRKSDDETTSLPPPRLPTTPSPPPSPLSPSLPPPPPPPPLSSSPPPPPPPLSSSPPPPPPLSSSPPPPPLSSPPPPPPPLPSSPPPSQSPSAVGVILQTSLRPKPAAQQNTTVPTPSSDLQRFSFTPTTNLLPVRPAPTPPAADFAPVSSNTVSAITLQSLDSKLDFVTKLLEGILELQRQLTLKVTAVEAQIKSLNQTNTQLSKDVSSQLITEKIKTEKKNPWYKKPIEAVVKELIPMHKWATEVPEGVSAIISLACAFAKKELSDDDHADMVKDPEVTSYINERFRYERSDISQAIKQSIFALLPLLLTTELYKVVFGTTRSKSKNGGPSEGSAVVTDDMRTAWMTTLYASCTLKFPELQLAELGDDEAKKNAVTDILYVNLSRNLTRTSDKAFATIVIRSVVVGKKFGQGVGKNLDASKMEYEAALVKLSLDE